MTESLPELIKLFVFYTRLAPIFHGDHVFRKNSYHMNFYTQITTKHKSFSYRLDLSKEFSIQVRLSFDISLSSDQADNGSTKMPLKIR